MRKILLVSILLPCFCSAQSAFKVFDKTTYSISEVMHMKDSVNAVDPGWRLPTAKEMQAVYTSTYDPHRLRSSLTSSTCYCADTTAGIMRGREFTHILQGYDFAGQPAGYSFFLVK